MPILNVNASVKDMLGALEAVIDDRDLENFGDLPDGLILKIDADISKRAIENAAIDMGYVHEDDALDEVKPHLRDLRDGLTELMRGDQAMGATLLIRALDNWPDGARIVEEVLLGRTVHNHRQLTLLAA